MSKNKEGWGGLTRIGWPILRGIAPFMVALIFLGTAGPVGAQMLCAERAQILEKLAAGYKEAPVAMGLASNGALIEILTHKEGDTWTILATQPNGVSCVMATGESWQDVDRLAMSADPES